MTDDKRPQPSMSDEFKAIDEFLDAATSVLREGHMPDLTQLLKRVTYLCERLQTDKTVDKEKAAQHLSVILEKINRCESELKEWPVKKSSPVG